MDNIIEQDKLGRHTVQRYRFKVLGSMTTDDMQTEDETQEIPLVEKKSVKKDDKVDDNQNKFVEELLKKSDTLSTNIIKLQMQIEKQESEFENRLKESIAREKEIAFDEGYSKAKSELESSFSEKSINYIESAKKLSQKAEEFDKFLKNLEKNLLDTSLEVAREVIKKEIEISSSKVAEALAKELIDDLKDANKITLKVNPKDFDALQKVFANSAKIDVEADSAISLGGVVLLSEKGNLDGNLSSRLEKVKYLLQSEVES